MEPLSFMSWTNSCTHPPPSLPTHCRPPLQATAAAATMAQQLLVWLLAVSSPKLFSRLRPLLYAFSATFPTASRRAGLWRGV